MHCRSKSQPEFYLDKSLHGFNARSIPKTFEHVKDVTSKIMDGFYPKQDDSGVKVKEHMNFLESRLFAAHNHICKLEQKASEESWTDEKIHEISAAMKEYITDAETKEAFLKVRITQLEEEVCKLAKLDMDNEVITNNLKQDLARKYQECQSEMTKKMSELEMSIERKDDEMKRLKAQLSKSEAKSSELQEQNASLFVELNGNKVKHSEDLQLLKRQLEESNQENQTLINDVLRLNGSLKSSKLMEERLQEELLSAKKNSEEKNSQIQKLSSEIESLRAVSTQGLEQNKILEVEIKQASQNEERLLLNIKELQKETQKNIDSMNEVKQQTDKLQSSIQDMEKEKISLEASLGELQEENSYLRYCTCEMKNEISHLSAEYNEAVNQNHLMKHQMEMKENSSIKSNADQETVTQYINSHTAKIENRLKQDLSKLAEELSVLTKKNQKLLSEKQSSQFQLESRVKEVNEKLKLTEEKLSKTNEEKIRMQKDLDYYAAQMEECKKSLEESKLKIQEQNSIYFHCQVQHQHQIQKIKDLSDKMIDYEECKRENNALNRQLDQVSRKLEIIQNASNTTKHENEHSGAKNLENAYMSIRDLEGKCCSLRKENDEYREKLLQYAKKIKELEGEGYQMNSMFRKLKVFMNRTRNEINLLVNEYHKEEQRNKVLFEQIEKFKNSSNGEEREMVKYKEQAERSCNQLKEMQIQCNDLSKSKTDMQHLLNEKEVELVTISNINQQLDWIVKDAKTLIDNLRNDLQSKTKEVEGLRKQACQQHKIFEKLQNDYMTELQNFEEEKMRNDQLTNAYNCLQNEIEERKELSHSHQENFFSLINNENVYKAKLQEKEEQIDAVRKENRNFKEELEATSYKNQDLSTKIKQLQVENEKLSSMKLQLINKITCLSNQLSSKTEQERVIVNEREQLQEKLREIKCQKKEMSSKHAVNQEFLDKLKCENKELVNNLESLRGKLEKSNEDVQSRSLSVKELQSEKHQLKQTIQSKEEDVCSLKAKLSELQGVVDGRAHKQNWIVQYGQDQLNEINILRQKNKDLEEEKLRLKELIIRADVKCEKLTGEIRIKEKDLNESLRATDDAEKELQRFSKSSNEQTSLLKQNLIQLTLKEEKTRALINRIEAEKQDLIMKIQDDEHILKNLTEKYENSLKDLKCYKFEIAKLLDQKDGEESRLKNFKGEFFKLVQILKQLKKERDSLKAIFSSNEEECQKFQAVNHRLQADMNQMKQNLLECAQEKRKTQSENDTLKSKLRILKFAEATREVERKEILEKLKDYEEKLKKKDMSMNTLTSLKDIKKYEKVEQTDRTSPGCYADLVFNLQKALSGKIEENTTISPEVQQMREFLKMIQNKGGAFSRSKLVPHCGENIRKTDGRKRNASKSSRKNMVENLFRESCTLQETLLHEISTISNKLVFESSSH